MAEGVISISNIRGFGRLDIGHFKASSEQLGWKNKRTGQVFQYKHNEVAKAEWIRYGRESTLKLHFRDSNSTAPSHFDGFQEKDVEIVSKHFQRYFQLPIDRKKISTKGWHWGEWKVEDDILSLSVDDKVAFEIPTPHIQQVTTLSKTDLSLELHPDTTPDNDDTELIEIRFYVPPSLSPLTPTPALSSDPLLPLKNALTSHNLHLDASESILASLPEVNLIVPRGKFTLDYSADSFRLHGKTHNHTILYSSINVLFLLPKQDGNNVLLVMGLSDSIRQGQTRYPFLLFQFDAYKEIELPINNTLKDSDVQLEPMLHGPVYKVVSQLCHRLSRQPVITPGEFQSMNGHKSISCSYKAQDGLLFPLNKHIVFVQKPIIWIRLSEVLSVELLNIHGATRYFEIKVVCKNNVEYEFSSVEKNELKGMLDFWSGKVVLKGVEKIGEKGERRDVGRRGEERREREEEEEEDEDDEDFDAEQFGDSEEDFDGSEEESEEERERREKKEKKKEKKEKKDKKEKKKDKKEKKSSKKRQRSHEDNHRSKKSA